MNPYLDSCEHLWRNWVAGDINASPAVTRRFDLDACPEPYLLFGDQERPLVVVTTNPGATMPHQTRAKIEAGRSVVDPSMTYREVARAMADFYVAELTGPARTRILAQRDLAEAAGYTGVLQVECFPWHAKKLPGKNALPRLLEKDEGLSPYVNRLGPVVRSNPSVALSAVWSGADLEAEELGLSVWLDWLRAFLAIDAQESTRLPLVRNERKVTCTAMVSGDSPPRALVMMMGGNHFPSERNRAPLVDALATPPS